MELKSKELAFLVVLGVLLSTLGVCSNIRGRLSTDGTQENETVKIMVHVAGLVKEPGVYSLPAGSRTIDAILAAGGALTDADIHRLNLAAYVTDGDKINVPGLLAASNQESGVENGLVNINTADQSTLETLPSIGPVRAEKIIEYRTLHGGFSSVEEIMNVSGIGAAIYEEIKDLVTY